MIAQLVEHCTGIVEVMGSNPVQAIQSRISFDNTTHVYSELYHKHNPELKTSLQESHKVYLKKFFLSKYLGIMSVVLQVRF